MAKKTGLNDDFAVFILSHGRPLKIRTLSALKNGNYTGRLYIIIDNEDKCKDEYLSLYGDMVIVFDKKEVAASFDEGDNFNDRRAVIYARNASFDIAKGLGIKYFLQLDDDYRSFNFRITDAGEYIDQNSKSKIKNLDLTFSYLLEYYKAINALSIAIAQTGDYIGGKDSDIFTSIGRRRKCMNTFFCCVDRPFKFFGRVNEDVNTYTNLQNRGGLFLTFPLLSIQQIQTQSNSGGMTEMYLDSGTYIKSFYSVMYTPGSVCVELMKTKNGRLHHKIDWRRTVPCIVPESVKK